jgi:DME family drug/metabolite transporter
MARLTSEPARPTSISRLEGSLLVLATGVVFSFGALVFRQTDDIGPWEYLVFRSAGALLLTMSLFALQNRGRIRTEVRAVSAAHVGAGVIIGLMFCSFIVALSETTTAFILFFQGASPVLAAVCSWFILRERMTREAWIATAGSIVGVVIIVSAGLGSAPLWILPVVGFIPIGFGLYTTLIRVGDDIDPSLPVIVAALTALTLAIGATFVGGGFDASGKDRLLGVFAGAILLGLPLPVFTFANRAVPAPETTLLMMSEVVLAPIWVWVFVSEVPGGETLLGGAVILVSVGWLTLRTAASSVRLRTSRG